MLLARGPALQAPSLGPRVTGSLSALPRWQDSREHLRRRCHQSPVAAAGAFGICIYCEKPLRAFKAGKRCVCADRSLLWGKLALYYFTLLPVPWNFNCAACPISMESFEGKEALFSCGTSLLCQLRAPAWLFESQSWRSYSPAGHRQGLGTWRLCERAGQPLVAIHEKGSWGSA